MADEIDRAEGRQLFGVDPEAYDRARPPYPGRVYEMLVDRFGLGDGSRVLEIGAGTGLASVEVLERGAQLVAGEPDRRLAAALAARAGESGDIEIIEGTFEAADLDEVRFDLAVSATAFHWVDEEAGLAKIFRALRSGGRSSAILNGPTLSTMQRPRGSNRLAAARPRGSRGGRSTR